MSNWQQKTLAEIAETASGGTPSRSNKLYYLNGTIPWIKSGELNDDLIYDSEEKITKEAIDNSSAKIFQKGSLLIALYGATAGKTAILGINASTNQAICRIKPKSEEVFTKYLQFFLIKKRGHILGSRYGGAQPNISQTIIKNLIISYPHSSIQKQIAQILSTLQKKVELVDKQIKLYEELKKSTMEKLFSEGLHGEKQKETEIGLIPESWEVKKIDNLCVLQRGKDLPKRDFIDGKIPVAGSNGVIGYHNKFTTEAIGVTVGRSGSVGKANIYFTDFWAHNTVLYIKDFFGNDRVFTYYYLDYLNLQKYSSGVSVPTLNRNVFSSILISIPTLKEQREISEVLGKTDKKIKKLTSKKKSYQQLFNSMLHKLMNQEIEVTEW